MMTDKDIKEHHKMVKKLEKQVKEKKYGEEETEKLVSENY